VFFDRFQTLCEKKGVSVYRACTDVGLNRSAVAKWKAGGKPNGTNAGRLAAYLGVTTDFLLEGKEPEATGRQVSDEEIKFALFGGEEVTDAVYEEVKRFAAFVRQREAEKKE